MRYAVDMYLDQIREKLNGWYPASHYHYFDSREAANKFIRGRAEGRLRAAEKALSKAADRVRRVNKKFA